MPFPPGGPVELLGRAITQRLAETMGQPFVFDREFIALARARPGQLHYASAGVGSPQHVTGALFASMAGIELTHVAYKGNSPEAFTGFLANDIPRQTSIAKQIGIQTK